VTSDRQAQLAASLTEVRERIDRACRAADREPGSVTLVAITKTYPASDVEVLAALGVTDVGENKDQEARAKAAAVRAAVRWHFVGRLQRNKAKSVVTYADVVESVDSVRLVQALAGAVERHRDRPLDVLVQVSIDGDPARGGAVADDVPALAEALAAEEGLILGGVMAVAPLSMAPADAFTRLLASAAVVRAIRPGATVISAGMSGDLEAAVGAGATHLRIGTALLGDRGPRVR
jgi:PLP dependent protein